MRSLLATLLIVFTIGCTNKDKDVDTDAAVDFDQDGFPEQVDCNDQDDQVFPGAPELCDGRDNDCDDVIDDEPQGGLTYYHDGDQDGFGDPNDSMRACSDPDGFVSDNTDCNDEDFFTFPGADETCNGRDDDCDGDVDEDAGLTFYTDADGDGFGDPNSPIQTCNGGPLPTNGDDCNDNQPNVHPGADEVCDGFDNNCDGEVDDDDLDDLNDSITWYFDKDGDGYGTEDKPVIEQCAQPEGFTDKEGDCDETDPLINPGAPEFCDDGIDNDCKNGVDDGNAVNATTYYEDADGDTFGNPNESQRSCDPISGYVDNSNDCDDTDAELNPAKEWWEDDDGDGYGISDGDVERGCIQPPGFADNDEDCDDTDDEVYPENTEACDGKDNDCNDVIDDEIADTTYYIDADGDGYGVDTETIEACDVPEGYADNTDDCDDTDDALHPDTEWYADTDQDDYGDANTAFGTAQCEAPEGDWAPNDEDCDDGDAGQGAPADWYLDDDEDGYGDPDQFEATQCDAPTTDVFADNDEDCDDTDADVNPDSIWYFDGDGDGYGSDAFSTPQCEAPDGLHVLEDGDCDDLFALVYPGMSWFTDADGDGYGDDTSELVDQDCEPPDNDSVPVGGDCDDQDVSLNPDTVWYLDDDGDGLGDPDLAWPTSSCPQPDSDYVANGDDCDDLDPVSGLPAVWYEDQDQDGYGVDGTETGVVCRPGPTWADQGGDCNDEDARVVPGMDWFVDTDGDGYGEDSTIVSTQGCDQPGQDYVPVGGDCDETDPLVNPATFWFADDDQDGFGDPDQDLGDASCTSPDPDAVPNGWDCDDGDANVGAGPTWYADTDGDDYGDPDEAWPVPSCSQPESGYVDNDEDCDDTEPLIKPNMVWYLDLDGDGYGLTALDQPTAGCEPPTSSHVPYPGDCDENRTDVNPGEDEVWYDGLDADCDGADDYDQDGDGAHSYYDADGGDCADQDPTLTFCGEGQAAAAVDCAEILDAGLVLNGPYWLDPDADGDTTDAWRGWCDLGRGGWTLLMMNNQAVSSTENPGGAEVVSGGLVRGGDLNAGVDAFDLLVGLGEWGDLGTDVVIEVGDTPGTPIHQASYVLSVDPDDAWRLSVSDETLLVGTESSGLFLDHDGLPFSTLDQDNDNSAGNCAATEGHPWWYDDCWSGSLWGSGEDGFAYWVGNTDAFAWGAMWAR